MDSFDYIDIMDSNLEKTVFLLNAIGKNFINAKEVIMTISNKVKDANSKINMSQPIAEVVELANRRKIYKYIANVIFKHMILFSKKNHLMSLLNEYEKEPAWREYYLIIALWCQAILDVDHANAKNQVPIKKDKFKNFTSEVNSYTTYLNNRSYELIKDLFNDIIYNCKSTTQKNFDLLLICTFAIKYFERADKNINEKKSKLIHKKENIDYSWIYNEGENSISTDYEPDINQTDKNADHLQNLNKLLEKWKSDKWFSSNSLDIIEDLLISKKSIPINQFQERYKYDSKKCIIFYNEQEKKIITTTASKTKQIILDAMRKYCELKNKLDTSIFTLGEDITVFDRLSGLHHIWSIVRNNLKTYLNCNNRFNYKISLRECRNNSVKIFLNNNRFKQILLSIDYPSDDEVFYTSIFFEMQRKINNLMIYNINLTEKNNTSILCLNLHGLGRLTDYLSSLLIFGINECHKWATIKPSWNTAPTKQFLMDKIIN